MLTLPDFNAKNIIIVFANEGDKFSINNDNLVVRDKEGKCKCQCTCYKIFALMIVGGFNITTGLVDRAKKFGFSIILMTHNFKVYERLNFQMEGNTLLREKQYANTKELQMAKEIVKNKIQNEINVLRKIREREDRTNKVIENLKLCISKIENDTQSVETLMGVEGIAAKIYFKEIFSNVKWSGRQPRVKRDETNLLLDIGYTMLFNYIESITSLYGFDIYKGILHKEFYKRKSLICDLIEPFRVIVDYKIRKMYSLQQINVEDFTVRNGRYELEWKKSSKYIQLFIEEIINYKIEIFTFIQSYYRWFMKGGNIESFPMVKL